MSIFTDILTNGIKIERKPNGTFVTAKYGIYNSVAGEIITPQQALAFAPTIGSTMNGSRIVNNVFCSGSDFELASDGSTNQWVMTVTYEPESIRTRAPSSNGACQIEANAVTVQKKTFQNNAGGVMYVTATDTVGNPLPQQPVEADIQFPMTYLTYKRLEPLPFNFALKQPFVGTINIATWQTYAPRQVLCVAIKTSDEQGGVMVSYEFQAYGLTPFINVGNWLFPEVYKNPETKEPITENLGAIGGVVNSTTSPAVFNVYPETDFNAMNLH